MCQPRARFPRGVSCTLAHSGTLATFNASLTSTPTKERKPISFQNTPTPAGPGASPAMAAHPKLRSAGIMAYFTTSSKPELQPQQCLGKAKALEHEYPIQFMTALANSMQRIVEVCPCFLVVEPVPLVLLIVTDWSLLAGMSEYRSQDTSNRHCTEAGLSGSRRRAGVASSSCVDTRSEGCMCSSVQSG